MWIGPRKVWFVLFVSFVWTTSVFSICKAESILQFESVAHDRLNFLSYEWTSLIGSSISSNDLDCKDNVTTRQITEDNSWEDLEINFQPKDRFDILGVSMCRNETREDCYVLEIFGLVSGHLGYFWRKHFRNETGEELWVPGKKTKMPSSIIKSDVVIVGEPLKIEHCGKVHFKEKTFAHCMIMAKKGTWDREGKTVYKFYIETSRSVEPRDDVPNDYVQIRYNGGTAKQQREMTFEIPRWQYEFYSVASYNNDGNVDVEGASGCAIEKRFIFESGQDVLVDWEKPLGAIGMSLCTDSGQSECYVFEMIGISDEKPNYFWRNHSLLEEGVEEGWVPGLDTKTKGIVLAQGENVLKFMDNSAWNDESKIRIQFTRTKGKLTVTAFYPYGVNFNEIFQPVDLLELPSNFQYTVIQSRVIVDEKEVNRADLSMHGPCFYGFTFGYSSPFCKQPILSKDFFNPEHSLLEYRVIYPKPGKAEVYRISKVLESRATRRNLCVYVTGIAGLKGGRIVVTAIDASGKSNETIHVGELVYNNIFPLDWQHVRMPVELPPPLQNVPLRVKITAERPTAESIVLLDKAELCSDDGCGVPTADGTPFIAFGKKTNPAKYPWHVAIFRKTDDTQYEHICGGTLVRSDAVISAAHCFFDDKGQFQDKSKFKLAVGKKFNSLYVFEPNQQLSDALNIDIAPRYRGDVSNYIHDIAIVRVNFTISPKVLPACVNWFGNNAPTLQSGDVGQVAGWGLNEENIRSSELYFAELPFISFDECIKVVPKTFVVYVTPDKFCAGNINGSTVKRGDSGGGLVFQKGDLWYLRGVVSLGVPQELTYTTFTDISQFTTWIKGVLKITE